MKREDFDIAAGIVERMDKLEHSIFCLQEIMNKKSYAIIASSKEDKIDNHSLPEYFVKLNCGEIATEVFIQDILEYYVNTLNLELEELRKSLEEI